MMSEQQTLGNPAVVGLAGFGLTTLILQIHNLGFCGIGPILALAFVFGGAAQLIAGYHRFYSSGPGTFRFPRVDQGRGC
jgi:succinate-acetate transporter protein